MRNHGRVKLAVALLLGTASVTQVVQADRSSHAQARGLPLEFEMDRLDGSVASSGAHIDDTRAVVLQAKRSSQKHHRRSLQDANASSQELENLDDGKVELHSEEETQQVKRIVMIVSLGLFVLLVVFICYFVHMRAQTKRISRKMLNQKSARRHGEEARMHSLVNFDSKSIRTGSPDKVVPYPTNPTQLHTNVGDDSASLAGSIMTMVRGKDAEIPSEKQTHFSSRTANRTRGDNKSVSFSDQPKLTSTMQTPQNQEPIIEYIEDNHEESSLAIIKPQEMDVILMTESAHNAGANEVPSSIMKIKQSNGDRDSLNNSNSQAYGVDGASMFPSIATPGIQSNAAEQDIHRTRSHQHDFLSQQRKTGNMTMDHDQPRMTPGFRNESHTNIMQEDLLKVDNYFSASPIRGDAASILSKHGQESARLDTLGESASPNPASDQKNKPNQTIAPSLFTPQPNTQILEDI